jgi:hypothetical protein
LVLDHIYSMMFVKTNMVLQITWRLSPVYKTALTSLCNSLKIINIIKWLSVSYVEISCTIVWGLWFATVMRLFFFGYLCISVSKFSCVSKPDSVSIFRYKEWPKDSKERSTERKLTELNSKIQSFLIQTLGSAQRKSRYFW